MPSTPSTARSAAAAPRLWRTRATRRPPNIPSGRPRIAPLDAVLVTEHLHGRPSRAADHEAENLALAALVQALADAPDTILQVLAETACALLRSGSAGLSLLTKDGRRFWWAAAAGKWAAHFGGGTSRDSGPSGDVLQRDAPLLFTRWERRYPHLAAGTPHVEEGLFVPFYVGRKAVGTIWAMTHDGERSFDAEDLRLLQSLARFASAAYQAVNMLGEVGERRAALSLLEDAVQARALAEDRSPGCAKVRSSCAAARRRCGMRISARMSSWPCSRTSCATRWRRSGMRWPPTARANGRRTRESGSDEIMERQIAHMSRLLDDLLDISRITRGKLELKKEPAELTSVLSAAIETARPLLDTKRHALSLEFPREAMRLEADAVRLAQVFSNLLINAAKYTNPHGSIHLSAAPGGR